MTVSNNTHTQYCRLFKRTTWKQTSFSMRSNKVTYITLEKEMATHSSILAWKISWREKPGRHSPWGQKKSDMSEHTHHTTEYHLLKAIGKSVCTHYKRCPYYIAECKKEISGQNIFF